VRIKATALNRADILQRKGKYPPPPNESQILGLEMYVSKANE
jgi:NADPH:quinone reductase-like Zn-dependent oxidoreductase